MCLPIAGRKTIKTVREWPQTLTAEAPDAPARRPGVMASHRQRLPGNL